MTMSNCKCGITPKSTDNPLGICRACSNRILRERGGAAPRRSWRADFERYMPWLLSALTVWMNWLAGSNAPHAWGIGLLTQAGWLAWIIAGKHWGFLPMNIALWVVYGRNHLLWIGG